MKSVKTTAGVPVMVTYPSTAVVTYPNTIVVIYPEYGCGDLPDHCCGGDLPEYCCAVVMTYPSTAVMVTYTSTAVLMTYPSTALMTYPSTAKRWARQPRGTRWPPWQPPRRKSTPSSVPQESPRHPCWQGSGRTPTSTGSTQGSRWMGWGWGPEASGWAAGWGRLWVSESRSARS